jgi:hypothetical protein
VGDGDSGQVASAPGCIDAVTTIFAIPIQNDLPLTPAKKSRAEARD